MNRWNQRLPTPLNFPSNGGPGSYGLTNNFYDELTDDSDAYFYYGDTWQNFWDPNMMEPG
jgi:hypothetical protein